MHATAVGGSRRGQCFLVSSKVLSPWAITKLHDASSPRKHVQILERFPALQGEPSLSSLPAGINMTSRANAIRSPLSMEIRNPSLCGCGSGTQDVAPGEVLVAHVSIQGSLEVNFKVVLWIRWLGPAGSE